MPYDSNGNWYAPTGTHKMVKPSGSIGLPQPMLFPPIVFNPSPTPPIVFNPSPLTQPLPSGITIAYDFAAPPPPFDFTPPPPLKCTCDIMALMARGCKCGQFEREQKAKN